MQLELTLSALVQAPKAVCCSGVPGRRQTSFNKYQNPLLDLSCTLSATLRPRGGREVNDFSLENHCLTSADLLYLLYLRATLLYQTI